MVISSPISARDKETMKGSHEDKCRQVPPNDNASIIQIGCVVPVHNTRLETITSFIQKLPKRISEIYLVINDTELLECCIIAPSIREGVVVLEMPFQVGKLEAYRYAMEIVIRKTKCDVLAQTDCRSKQPPEELDNLIDKLVNYDYDLVVADRYAQQNMEGQEHRIGIAKVLSLIVAAITPYKLGDIACGTRVYTKKLATKFLNLRGFGYGLEIEQILICAMHNILISQVPVNSNRQHDLTNAEKIEDTLYVLISYCQQLNVEQNLRNLLCHMLVSVKKRDDFEVDLSIFHESGYVLWKYVHSESVDTRGAYATQVPKDGYALYVRSV